MPSAKIPQCSINRASIARSRYLFILVFVVTLTFACDPGISFKPNGWSQIGNNRWHATFDDIEVETGWFGGFIGSTSLSQELTITNRSEFTIEITKPTLKIHDKFYEGKFTGGEESRTIDKGTSRVINVSWEFSEDNPIYKSLDSDIADIVLAVHVGNRESTFIIPMIREM